MPVTEFCSNRCTDGKRWYPSSEGKAECLGAIQMNYSLGNLDKRYQTTTDSSWTTWYKRSSKLRQSSFFVWYHEISCCKVDMRKLWKLRLVTSPIHLIFKICSSYGLQIVSLSVVSSALEKLNRRRRSQNGPRQLLRGWDPLSISVLATSHR